MLSPWRIRVTVEAEPDITVDQAAATRSTSHTTKVPLKLGSSPSNPATRTAPRHQSSPTKGRKRTPPRKSTRGGRQRRPSVTDLDIIVLEDEDNPWSNRGSPRRKSRARSKGVQDSGGVMSLELQHGIGDGSRSQETDVEDPLGIEHAVPQPQGGQGLVEDEIELQQGFESPKLRSIDLNRVSLRTRPPYPREDDLQPDGVQPQVNARSVDDRPKSPRRRNISDTSAASYPSPVSSSQDVQEEPKEVNIGPGEFDTVLESEGFTMIDLSSLSSARQLSISPPQNSLPAPPIPSAIPNSKSTPPICSKVNGSVPVAKLHQVLTSPTRIKTAIPSYLSLPEGDSDLSSTVPSSPPVHTAKLRQLQPLQSRNHNRKVTPEPYSSPRLPSPPKAAVNLREGRIVPVLPSAKVELENGIELSRAVKAGKALQGVLSPDIDFGQELSQTKPDKEDVSTANRLAQQTWRGETTVQHTPPVNRDSPEDLAMKRNRAATVQSLKENKKARSTSPESRIPRTTGKSQSSHDRQSAEVQGKELLGIALEFLGDQTESAQAGEEASEEVVTVADETDGDIWLAEARKVSDPLRENDEVEEEVAADKTHAKSLDRDHPHDSSALTASGDVSGILWQQSGSNSSAGFGGGALRRRRLASRQQALEAAQRHASRHVDEPNSPQPAAKNSDDLELLDRPPTEDDQEASLVALEECHASDYSSLSDLSEDRPQTVRVPVKFNDSALSETASTAPLTPQEADSFQETRPPTPTSTPRSAMKGTRISLNLEQDSVKKVLWSSQNRALDESGIESSLRMKSMSLTPEPVGADGNESHTQAEQESFDSLFDSKYSEEGSLTLLRNEEVPDRSRARPPPRQRLNHVEQKTSSKSWLGWLWSGKSDTDACQDKENSTSFDSANERAQVRPINSSLSHAPTKEKLHKTTTSLDTTPEESDTSAQVKNSSIPAAASASTTSTNISSHIDSVPPYLLAPSYPTLPSRDPTTTPLSTSGPFTKTHYQTLHIIYTKSLRRRFHAPRHIRPGIVRLLRKGGRRFEWEHGDEWFSWVFDENGARVVERFMQEVERDWELLVAGGEEKCEWGWSEAFVAYKLFRLICGNELRRGGRKEEEGEGVVAE